MREAWPDRSIETCDCVPRVIVQGSAAARMQGCVVCCGPTERRKQETAWVYLGNPSDAADWGEEPRARRDQLSLRAQKAAEPSACTSSHPRDHTASQLRGALPGSVHCRRRPSDSDRKVPVRFPIHPLGLSPFFSSCTFLLSVPTRDIGSWRVLVSVGWWYRLWYLQTIDRRVLSNVRCGWWDRMSGAPTLMWGGLQCWGVCVC
jgi:hypothetical protein